VARTLAILAIASAGASCAILDTVERELVFRPRTADWAGYSPAILNEEEVWIPVGGGTSRLNGWWLASPGAEYTLVYFHGARVNLSGSVYRLRGFREAGFNVLAIDYRGFGRSSPLLPSEETVYEDAEAAWNWLDARVPERSRRIIYGHSLGGPIAAETALRGGGAAALVLESSFTSLAEMTKLGGLLTQRMDLLDKLARLDLPVLVVHGADDTIVPPEMARRLYAAARGPKRLVMVEGAAHSWVLRRAGRTVFATLRELADASR
jgi:pimeloyl-ACP methyl ester carboxylesterase